MKDRIDRMIDEELGGDNPHAGNYPFVLRGLSLEHVMKLSKMYLFNPSGKEGMEHSLEDLTRNSRKYAGVSFSFDNYHLELDNDGTWDLYSSYPDKMLSGLTGIRWKRFNL